MEPIEPTISTTDERAAEAARPRAASGRGGATAGRRRGTALIVVIGALSLVAVFAALYVTIGQGDQRTAVAAEETRATADVDEAFANRILDVLVADRLSVFPVPTIDGVPGAAGTPNAQRFLREATDYPYTDWTMRSQFPPPDGVDSADDPWTPDWAINATGDNASIVRGLLGFNAEGDASMAWGDAPAPLQDRDPRTDRRVASDPWLAATEPTTVVWRQLPVFGTHSNTDPNRPETDGRAYSLLKHGNATERHSHPVLRFLDHRDWAQISNIAPDGRFVNLFNLRDNFEAEPGIGNAGGDDYRMTSRLTLLEPTTFRRFEGLRASTQLPFDLGDLDENGDGEVEDVYLNMPAIWTMNQRFMFFPMNQPEQFGIGVLTADDVNNSPNQVSDWGDFTYPDYQYADADGDGMADSRWFELVDASDPDNVSFDLPIDQMRFFAAARIIDLSALVNVNTATDNLSPPTNWSPSGMTPADVDLRRLLAMTDQARAYRNLSNASNSSNSADAISLTGWRDWTLTSNTVAVPAFVDGLSYRYIEHPLGYTTAEGRDLIVQNYFGYHNTLDGASPSVFGTPFQQISKLAGAMSYDAIRRSIEGDDVIRLTGGQDGAWFGQVGSTSPRAFLLEPSPFEYVDAGVNRSLYGRLTLGNATTNPYSTLSNIDRSLVARDHYFDIVGRLDVSDRSLEQPDPNEANRFGDQLFGVNDLAELLTFRSVNDDASYSRLERVTAERFDNQAGTLDPNSTLRFSPLRSNRSTSLERRSHDNVDAYFNEYPTTSPLRLIPDNAIDGESMALFALSPRGRLTTVSGASQIRQSVVHERNDNSNPPTYSVFTGGTVGAPGLNPIGVEPEDDVYVDTFRTLERDSKIDLRELLDGYLDGSAQVKRRSVDTLFRLYADALLPDSGLENGLAWEPSGGEHLWALAYGDKGPEPAAYAAAHLVVNMLDIADTDSDPTAATLLIDGRKTGSSGEAWAYGLELDSQNAPDNLVPPLPPKLLEADERGYAFQWGYAEDGFLLDLDATGVNNVESKTAPANRNNTRLHRGTTGSGVDESRRAATVFGIEAHPIITEVSSLIVYTQSQALDTSSVPVPEPTFTADPDADPATNDVAVQAMAFQVHNPFDVPVSLGSLNLNDASVDAVDARAIERFDYYIEYNGWYYPLAGYVYDEADGRYEFRSSAALEPGETRVFYAFNHPDFESLESRWNAIEAAVDDPDFPTLAARDSKRFFDQQFGGPPKPSSGSTDLEDPTLLQPVNPATGERIADLVSVSTAGFDIFGPADDAGFAPPRPAEDQEVRLWRTYHNPSTAPMDGEALQFDRTGADPRQLWVENDILVDRLRFPAQAESWHPDSWDIAFDSNQTIDLEDAPNSQTFIPSIPFSGTRPLQDKFYTTFTVSRWASVRRPDHVDDSGNIPADGVPPRGAVPAYMLESTLGDTSSNVLSFVLPGDDLADTDPFNYRDDFRNGSEADDFLRGPADAQNSDDAFDDDRISDAYIAVSLSSFFDSVGFLQAIGATDPTTTASEPMMNDRPLIPSLRRDPADKGEYDVTHEDSLEPDTAGDGEVDLAIVFDYIDFNQNPPVRATQNVSTGTAPLVSPRTRADLMARELSDPRVQPELYTEGEEFLRGTGSFEVSVLRITDVLRPLAIGPTHFGGLDIRNMGDPTSTATDDEEGVGAPYVADGEWLTLGEALSVALGFEDDAFYDDVRDAMGAQTADYTPLGDAVQRFTDDSGSPGALAPLYMFDRGQIDLRAGAPFVNIARGNEALDIPLFQPELGDYRIGAGQPAATRLLSSFRTLSPLVDVDDPIRNHDLARPVTGTVNINTAPATVLRLLPGLTPSLEVDSFNNDESWAGRRPTLSTTALPDSNTSGFGGDPDLTQPDRRDLGLPDPRDPTVIGNYDVSNPEGSAPDLWRQRQDVAASILAYRDRTLAEFRFDSREPFVDDDRIDDLSYAPLFFDADFDGVPTITEREQRFGLLARNFNADFIAGAPGWSPAISADRGRFMLNGIEAVRELPGFGSPAELLGVTMAESDPLTKFGVANIPDAVNSSGSPIPGQQSSTPFINYGLLGFGELSVFGTPLSRWAGDQGVGDRFDGADDLTPDDDAPTIFGVHDMFALARDQRAPVSSTVLEPVNLGVRVIEGATNAEHVLTLDPYLYRNDGGTILNQPDELPNDYDEQLALLAGLMNTTDVRSDYFAAWFIVRGYERSDVENLGDAEPMLPSYEKRFLMIIDRSNVVDRQDQPRVLLYRELPL